MANLIERQITLDGQRNVAVKWSGVLDSAFTLTPALAVGDCVYNDPMNKLVGFRVLKALWSISQGLEINITWNGATPQLAFPVAGRGKFNMCHSGGFTPDQTRPGFDGALNLTAAGYPAGTSGNFTIILDLIKLYTPR